MFILRVFALWTLNTLTYTPREQSFVLTEATLYPIYPIRVHLRSKWIIKLLGLKQKGRGIISL